MANRFLCTRLRAQMLKEWKKARLELCKRRAREDLFVDYGWMRLLYTADSDDQEIAYHIHQQQWYEKDMHVFRSLVAPGDAVVDVGANIGFVTTMLASLVGPQGRVLAFEPSPFAFGKLLKTVAANGLEQQVTPMNVGCGASRAMMRLHHVGRSSGNASILGSSREGVEIRLERLDDLPEVWAKPISLVKIDTEGYEAEVLKGARRLIEEHKPILYLEMGGDYVESTLESVALLDEAGYATDHVRSIEWSEVGNGSDYFFFPRELRRSRSSCGQHVAFA